MILRRAEIGETMLEKIDVSKKMGKKEFKEYMERMQPKLGKLQRKCKELSIPVIFVFEGFGASGKGTMIAKLIEPLDPRGFKVYTTQRATDEEKERPFMWRFFRKTPAKGKIAIFDRSWYTKVLRERIEGLTTNQELLYAFDEINHFEKLLVDDGTVIIKFFLHITKEEQRERFEDLIANPSTAWRVTHADWEHNKNYDAYLKMNDEMLEKTDHGYAPWTIIEAKDKEYAASKMYQVVIERLEQECKWAEEKQRKQLHQSEGTKHQSQELVQQEQDLKHPSDAGNEQKEKNDKEKSDQGQISHKGEERKENAKDKTKENAEDKTKENEKDKIKENVKENAKDKRNENAKDQTKNNTNDNTTERSPERAADRVEEKSTETAIKKIDTIKVKTQNQKQERNELTIEIKEDSDRFLNGVLNGIDLSKDIKKEDYKKRLKELQERLALLQDEMFLHKLPSVFVFEGWDASGKGGAIKRLTQKLDPRGYEVIPISAPDETERAHHYLWRFYQHIPAAGHMAIFDRSWYGRVMVERIEGFCSREEWARAYSEINQFEEQLTNVGTVVIKFWLQIDKEEQEKRFRAREETPGKEWKITKEDWRNRAKWDEYVKAVDEMIVRTSTTYAPWVVIEANSKPFARIKILETIVDAFEVRLMQVRR